MSDFSFEVVQDFGAFGEGRWQKHLALVSWNGAEPKYDLRTWNDDMTRCGKGITLDLEDLMDLQDIIKKALDGEDYEDPDEEELGDPYEGYDEE